MKNITRVALFYLKRQNIWAFVAARFFLVVILLAAFQIFTLAQNKREVLQEVPPKPFTVTYAPADASISGEDPVTFLWLPITGAKSYILQYSRKMSFPDPETETVECTGTIYTPRKIMGEGTWYWRFGIKNENTSASALYSKIRRFTIEKNAVQIPFPNIKKTISDLNKNPYPKGMFNFEDVARLKKLAMTSLKGSVDNIKERCDAMPVQQLLPEPSFLPDDQLKRAALHLRIRQTYIPFLEGMNESAFVYLLTGEEKYGLEAKRRLLHIISWDPTGSTDFFHNERICKEIVLALSKTYGWIYPLLTKADKDKVKTVFSIKIPQMYKAFTEKLFEINPYDSHAAGSNMTTLLEACIAMSGEIPIENIFEYILQQYWSPFLPPWTGVDGGWSEGPGYWQYTVPRKLYEYILIKKTTGVDMMQKLWLQNTPFFKLYCNPPYSKMSPFGDEQEDPPLYNSMYKFGVMLNNPYCIWYNDIIKAPLKGLDEFLYHVESPPESRAPSDLPQARCFYDVGLACMHSNLAHGDKNVHFMLHSSPMGSISHSYANQNAFVLFAYGEPLAISSGYYPYYGSPHHNTWTRQTKASNSILINGQGQEWRNWDAKGKISAFATNEFAHFAVGDASAAYGGLVRKFLRHSFFLRPLTKGEEPVIVMYDDIETPNPSTFDWMLHSLEQMSIDEPSKTVSIKRGASRLRVRFLAPKKLNFNQTDQFTVRPELKKSDKPNQWHLTVQTQGREKAIKFVTVLLPYKNGNEANLPEVKLLEKTGWIVVEVIGKKTRHLISFRAGASKGSELRIGNMKTKDDFTLEAYDMNGERLGNMKMNADESKIQ